MRTFHQDTSRRTPGGAVISQRQRWLRPQLAAAEVGCRFLPIQGGRRGEILPPLRPPLVLDTAEMQPSFLAALLSEINVVRPLLPTIAIVDANDVLAQRLASLCSMIYAIVADTRLSTLPFLIRNPGRVGKDRLPHVRPAAVGFTPPPFDVTDVDLLAIVAELGGARNLDEVAHATGVSLPTLNRKLKNVRSAMGLPRGAVTKRPTPDDLASQLIAALRQTHTPDPSLSSSSRGQS